MTDFGGMLLMAELIRENALSYEHLLYVVTALLLARYVFLQGG